MSDHNSLSGAVALDEDSFVLAKKLLRRNKQLESASESLKAISEPIRMRQLFLMLHTGEIDVGSMYPLLGMGKTKQSLISHHLGLLRDAKLCKSELRGRSVYYSIRGDRRKAAWVLKGSGLGTDYIDHVIASDETVRTFDDGVELPDLPSELQINRAIHRVKACRDLTRLKVICCLLHFDVASVDDLCKLLGLSQPSVSHHLKRLRVLGQGDYDRDGKYNRYSLGPTEDETLQFKFEIASFLRGLGVRSEMMDYLISLGPPKQQQVERRKRRNDVKVPDLAF